MKPSLVNKFSNGKNSPKGTSLFLLYFFNIFALLSNTTIELNIFDSSLLLIPKIILNVLQNKEIPIYGKGENVRDWIYVDQHCDAIQKILSKGRSGESYNISGNNEINNLDIVNLILEKMNKSKDLIKFVEDRPGHDLRYSLDSRKILDELQWKNNLSFEEGLDKTIDWYLENSESFNSISPQVIRSDTPWK